MVQDLVSIGWLKGLDVCCIVLNKPYSFVFHVSRPLISFPLLKHSDYSVLRFLVSGSVPTETADLSFVF